MNNRAKEKTPEILLFHIGLQLFSRQFTVYDSH
jgi:hypothetical protein